MIERFDFSDLRELFAKANEEKSGDQLAGIGARSERGRVAAKRKLADLPLEEIVLRPLIDPSDDIGGILLSAFEGLLYGCGDAVLGVNPATDSVEAVSSILVALNRMVDAYEIPTQTCCLAHITTQLAALERGAPVDLLFQSVAGTEAANRSFGITLDMLRGGREQVLEHHRHRDVRWAGDHVMYFETGQGSALSAEAHHGVDQLTLEARAYGVARAFQPFLVNSVVGFIGPEYLYDERQIIRAGLEDHFMGKLLGLPLGCDVCYTNHPAADQNSPHNLLLLSSAPH